MSTNDTVGGSHFSWRKRLRNHRSLLLPACERRSVQHRTSFSVGDSHRYSRIFTGVLQNFRASLVFLGPDYRLYALLDVFVREIIHCYTSCNFLKLAEEMQTSWESLSNCTRYPAIGRTLTPLALSESAVSYNSLSRRNLAIWTRSMIWRFACEKDRNIIQAFDNFQMSSAPLLLLGILSIKLQYCFPIPAAGKKHSFICKYSRDSSGCLS